MDIPSYDPHIVNAVNNTTVEWGNTIPFFLICAIAFLVGMFALRMMMREYARLSQWDEEVPEPIDYNPYDANDHDIEIVSSQ